MRRWWRRNRNAAGAEPPPSPDRAGLFVIGSSQSGVATLRNALNSAPEISFEQPDRALPPIGRLRLGAKLPGTAIVVDTPGLDELFASHCHNSFQAPVIFTFRDPLEALRAAPRQGGGAGDPMPSLLTYVETVRLFIKMFRNLPRVRVVVHEDVSAATFEALGDWLGVPLPHAAACYRAPTVQHDDKPDLEPHLAAALAPIRQLFADLRDALREGLARPQLDQNDANLNPGHYTGLGRLARQAEMRAGELRARITGAVAAS